MKYLTEACTIILPYITYIVNTFSFLVFAMAQSMAQGQYPPREYFFRADRPFYFELIYHKNTTLFCGVQTFDQK